MALFSERNGFVKPREIFQIDSLDERTKNRIWNWVLENFINKISLKMYTNYIDLNSSHTLKHIFCDVYGQPADDPCLFTLDTITSYFKKRLFSGLFWGFLDVVELIVAPWMSYIDKPFGKDYVLQIKKINDILEQEKVGWRLTNGLMTRFVEKAEIDIIEDALKTGHKSVTEHVQCALRSFADKNNPDYRNAIQESFNAVEAWLKNEYGEPKADFRVALQKLKEQGKLDIHPTLVNAFKDFYAYMSDEKGLRHALLDKSAKFDFEETKCMIVFCCTMINYLETKKK